MSFFSLFLAKVGGYVQKHIYTSKQAHGKRICDEKNLLF